MKRKRTKKNRKRGVEEEEVEINPTRV